MLKAKNCRSAILILDSSCDRALFERVLKIYDAHTAKVERAIKQQRNVTIRFPKAKQ